MPSPVFTVAAIILVVLAAVAPGAAAVRLPQIHTGGTGGAVLSHGGDELGLGTPEDLLSFAAAPTTISQLPPLPPPPPPPLLLDASPAALSEPGPVPDVLPTLPASEDRVDAVAASEPGAATGDSLLDAFAVTADTSAPPIAALTFPPLRGQRQPAPELQLPLPPPAPSDDDSALFEAASEQPPMLRASPPLPPPPPSPSALAASPRPCITAAASPSTTAAAALPGFAVPSLPRPRADHVAWAGELFGEPYVLVAGGCSATAADDATSTYPAGVLQPTCYASIDGFPLTATATASATVTASAAAPPPAAQWHTFPVHAPTAAGGSGQASRSSGAWRFRGAAAAWSDAQQATLVFGGWRPVRPLLAVSRPSADARQASTASFAGWLWELSDALELLAFGACMCACRRAMTWDCLSPCFCCHCCCCCSFSCCSCCCWCSCCCRCSCGC